MYNLNMRYAYVFVRRDLPLRHQLVQACHAAMEAGSGLKTVDTVPNLILLDAENCRDLYDIAYYLDKMGIKYHMFFEPDNEYGHTAIGTEPLELERKELLSHFSLWRETRQQRVVDDNLRI